LDNICCRIIFVDDACLVLHFRNTFLDSGPPSMSVTIPDVVQAFDAQAYSRCKMLLNKLTSNEVIIAFNLLGFRIVETGDTTLLNEWHRIFENHFLHYPHSDPIAFTAVVKRKLGCVACFSHWLHENDSLLQDSRTPLFDYELGNLSDMEYETLANDVCTRFSYYSHVVLRLVREGRFTAVEKFLGLITPNTDSTFASYVLAKERTDTITQFFKWYSRALERHSGSVLINISDKLDRDRYVLRLAMRKSNIKVCVDTAPWWLEATDEILMIVNDLAYRGQITFGRHSTIKQVKNRDTQTREQLSLLRMTNTPVSTSWMSKYTESKELARDAVRSCIGRQLKFSKFTLV